MVELFAKGAEILLNTLAQRVVEGMRGYFEIVRDVTCRSDGHISGLGDSRKKNGHRELTDNCA